jgi:hypothetical protein
MEAPAKFDLAAVRTERFRLQVEQDEPRSAAVWDSDADWLHAWDWTEAGLDDQRHAIGGDLPWGVIGQSLVRQCRLRPPRVQETHFHVLTGHVRRCRIDDPAIEVGPQRCFAPMVAQEPVEFTHHDHPFDGSAICL